MNRGRTHSHHPTAIQQASLLARPSPTASASYNLRQTHQKSQATLDSCEECATDTWGQRRENA